jgi:glutamyl-tRNA synthetase
MPRWAHLPLILKPDGNGKLSKRDGDRMGFPVFAMDWKDAATGETITGFKERGFLPEAFVNMLALLGWNDGSEQEIFSLEELVERFSIERVHKGGAKFDYEKAKWFNHEWIKRLSAEELKIEVKQTFDRANIAVDDEKLVRVIELVKDRCTLLNDFITQASFFFQTPTEIDVASIKPKWDEKKKLFFSDLINALGHAPDWDAGELEKEFKKIAAAQQIKTGDLMLPLRIMLVGGKFGPGVFDIAAFLGKSDTIGRIEHTLDLLS